MRNIDLKSALRTSHLHMVTFIKRKCGV